MFRKSFPFLAMALAITAAFFSGSSTASGSDAVSTGSLEDIIGAPEAPYTFTPRGDRKRLTGGGYSGYLDACGVVQFGSKCKSRANSMQVTREFADYAMTNLPKCVSEGLKAEGYSGKFTKLIINGDTYANRDIRHGSTLSMHSTGRAIDLESLKITLDNGQQYNVNMTKRAAANSATNNFYKTLVKCWQNANRTRCAGTNGLSPRSGALDCTYNSDHYTHVHLSMPFCPHKPGIAKN